MSSWWRARRRDERGAIVPMVFILLPMLILIASLAVDIGQQRVGRSDMQALADVVSLDMVRLLDGRGAAALTSDPTWDAARKASVARNAVNFAPSPAPAPVVVAEPGLLDTTTGAFTVATGATVPNAVRVTSATKVDFTFKPGNGAVVRAAVAVPQKAACAQLGSYAAAVDSGQSALLSSLLGQISPGFDLGAAGYQGLATANVALLDVAAQLGFGSVNQLATATVSEGDFVAAIANVLANNGDTVDAQVLKQLSTSLTAAGNVNLGKLLSANTQGNGVNSAINVRDLLAGSAFLLSGNHLLSIPGLSTSVPGLAGVTSSVNLIEGKIRFCYRDPLPDPTTSQLGATVTGTVAPVVVPVAGLGNLTVGSPSGKTVQTALSLASASGRVTDATCATATTSAASESVQVTNGLASASTTIPLVASGQINVAGILGLVNVSFNLTVTLSKSSAPTITNITITVPPQKYATPYSTGTGNLALDPNSIVNTTSNLTATLVGGLATVNLSTAVQNSLVSAIDSAVVTPLVNQLNAAVIAPLDNLLGVRLGGSDVIADSHPTCNNPSLAQ